MSIEGLGFIHNFAEYYEKSHQAALEKKYYLAGGNTKTLDLVEKLRHLFFNESYSLKQSIENCTYLESAIKQKFKQCSNLNEMNKLFYKLNKDAIAVEKASLTINLEELNSQTIRSKEYPNLSTLTKEITDFFKKISHLLGLRNDESHRIVPEIEKIKGAYLIIDPLVMVRFPLLSDAVIECFSNLTKLNEENKKLKSQIDVLNSQSSSDELQKRVKKLEDEKVQLQKEVVAVNAQLKNEVESGKHYIDLLATTQKQLAAKDLDITNLQQNYEAEMQKKDEAITKIMGSKAKLEKEIQELRKATGLTSPTNSTSPATSTGSTTPPLPSSPISS